MRKFIAAGVMAGALSVAVASAGSAQTIGFKVGPTFSNVSIDPDQEGHSTLTSFGGGGFVRFGAAGLSLQLEALAVTKGFKSEDPNDPNNNAKLKLTYIEVPLTAMFRLGNGPYIFVGPAVSFEASCKVSVDFGGTSLSGDCDDDTSGESFPRKKVDFSGTAGAGFEIPAGPGHVLIEGRYTHGFVNMNDDDTDDTKIRHRSFAVFAGYAISLGRH